LLEGFWPCLDLTMYNPKGGTCTSRQNRQNTKGQQDLPPSHGRPPPTFNPWMDIFVEDYVMVRPDTIEE
jgi:hypothetical protein